MNKRCWTYVLAVVGFIVLNVIFSDTVWLHIAAPVVMAGLGFGLAEAAQHNKVHFGVDVSKVKVLPQRWYEERDIAKRADEQHDLYRKGDPKGFYGEYMPPADLLRPEFLMGKPEPVTKSQHELREELSENLEPTRRVGGDPRDIVWPNIAREVIRANHIRRLDSPTQREIRELKAIHSFFLRTVATYRPGGIRSIADLFGAANKWVMDNADFDMTEHFSTYLCGDVGSSFPWSAIGPGKIVV